MHEDPMRQPHSSDVLSEGDPLQRTRRKRVRRRACAAPRALRDRDLSLDDLICFCAERLSELTSRSSETEIASRTGFDVEDVRSYIALEREPSLRFVLAVLGAHELSAEWLLFGEGPEHLDDVAAEIIDRASSDELLTSLARRLDDLD
jgi:hypothetical protein